MRVVFSRTLKKYFCQWLVLVSLLTGSYAFAAPAEPWVFFSPGKDRLAIHSDKAPAALIYDSKDHDVVGISVRALSKDFAAVSGLGAKVYDDAENIKTVAFPRIYIGSLDSSALIQKIVAEQNLDVSKLQGAWESFLIRTIGVPGSPNQKALLIVGSDRRGTAYGVYELSQAIGVSPWHWWADVPAKKAKRIFVKKISQRFGPPSVKYRGIFINDEDWGLQPWAAQTIDKKLGNIGSNTYEKVFDLLLRLKANTLWPAMHKVSLAFNEVPENKTLADRYAIVMGSSHAEPLLRNNVREWALPAKQYNFQTHRKEVLNYWDERLKENTKFENVYTLGMRGIHDSGMQAGSSPEEKTRLVEGIIGDQRDLLQSHFKQQNINAIPQVFTPYKEVLELYRNGMKVPEDVSLVWPDDNHGYIRRFSTPLERKRSGGAGVYYHLSYLGAPMAYLWLYSTPPSLLWQEMHKAYTLGAKRHWIVNVGDIKPAELGAELFLQMAWNIDKWQLNNQHHYLREFFSRDFGKQGSDIAELMQGHFELNFQRKPEHLQWWRPHTKARGSDLSEAEIQTRLQAFDSLVKRCLALKKKLTPEQLDAYFELVEYPVLASAAANKQYFHLEQYQRWFHESLTMAKAHGRIAVAAQNSIKTLTHRFNNDIAGGKWRGFMAVEPADNNWRSFRQSPLIFPADSLLVGKEPKQLLYKGSDGISSQSADVYIEAENFKKSEAKQGQSWRKVVGLGKVGDAIGVFPVQDARSALQNIQQQAPYVEYDLELRTAGEYKLYLQLLPSFPVSEAVGLRVAYAIPGVVDEPQVLALHRKAKSKAWAEDVLSGSASMVTPLPTMAPGRYTLRVYGIDSGVLLDRLFLHQNLKKASYFGPR